jgi:hypothetical protein
MTGCMLYQCDRATANCRLSPRDYDRDGDPDKTCGGTDCNDFDPTINGLNTTCHCMGDPSPPEACSVGSGICKRSSTYTCKSGQLYCTQAGMPDPAVTYMVQPDQVTNSWDWNCNGVLEAGCRDENTKKVTACPQPNCDAAVKATIGSDNNVACQTFCSMINGADPKCSKEVANFAVCDNVCGHTVVTCRCAVNFITKTCQRFIMGIPAEPQYAITQSQILCK